MVNSTNTGGPAFPQVELDRVTGGLCDQHFGMTLRDYFAANALSSILAPHPITGQFAQVAEFEDCAVNAYKMADAMLKAREQ